MVLVLSQVLVDIYQKGSCIHRDSVPYRIILFIYLLNPASSSFFFFFFPFLFSFFLPEIGFYRGLRGHASSLSERQRGLREVFTPAVASWDSWVITALQLGRWWARFVNKSRTLGRRRGRVGCRTDESF